MDPWPVTFARALAAGTWGPLPEPAALEQAATSTAITDSATSSVTDRRPCTGFPPGWSWRAPPPGAARGRPGKDDTQHASAQESRAGAVVVEGTVSRAWRREPAERPPSVTTHRACGRAS